MMRHSFKERLHGLLRALCELVDIVFEVVCHVRESVIEGVSHMRRCFIQRMHALLDVVCDVSTGLIDSRDAEHRRICGDVGGIS